MRAGRDCSLGSSCKASIDDPPDFGAAGAAIGSGVQLPCRPPRRCGSRRATAATIWLTPTLKQEQTVAPGSGWPAPGRPATTREACCAGRHVGRSSCSTAQLRATATGWRREEEARQAADRRRRRQGADRRSGVGIAERLDMAGIPKMRAAPLRSSRRARRRTPVPAASRHRPWPSPNRRRRAPAAWRRETAKP